jgi:hypothetical protein
MGVSQRLSRIQYDLGIGLSLINSAQCGQEVALVAVKQRQRYRQTDDRLRNGRLEVFLLPA